MQKQVAMDRVDALGPGAAWCINGVVTSALETPTPSQHVKAKRSLVRGLVKTVRPHQWVKNVFVLAPMVFHKDLVVRVNGDPSLNLRVTGTALLGTIVFCLLAGAVYTINDLVDVDADRVHPVKRYRPIAAGDVPESFAWPFTIALVVVALGLASLSLNWMFAAVAALYFVENIAYSFKLKKVAFLDVGLIAFGFVLRVYAGGLATDTHVSWYMLACTALLALFLGFGKRRHELEGEHAGKQRAALEAYSKRSLTAALAITGVGDRRHVHRVHARRDDPGVLPDELPVADGAVRRVRHLPLPDARLGPRGPRQEEREPDAGDAERRPVRPQPGRVGRGGHRHRVPPAAGLSPSPAGSTKAVANERPFASARQNVVDQALLEIAACRRRGERLEEREVVLPRELSASEACSRSLEA